MFSGGVGSWAAAKRVAERFGTADMVLLFTDTLIEDADLYRFLGEAARDVGAELLILADGRTPWEVFRTHGKKGFLGNSRVAHCSIKLKQNVSNAWAEANCDPADTVLYYGIDWTEEHRLEGVRKNRPGWRCEAPLCDAPYRMKEDILEDLAACGIEVPRLYKLGFAHNNCGGGCVKAGQGHFAHLLRTLPDVFAEWERNENMLRAQIGNVAILRDRRGGTTKPLPLSVLRSRVSCGDVDEYDIGGCGCFVEG